MSEYVEYIEGIDGSIIGRDASGDMIILQDYSSASPSPATAYSKYLLEDMKDPTGFINQENIVITYNSTARTITLSATTGTVDYYWQGIKHTLGAVWTSSAHTATANSWFLLSSDGNIFRWSTTPWNFTYVMVAYKPANKDWAVSEIHGVMQYQVHRELHDNIGTYRRSGFGLSGGTYQIQPADPVDTDNQPSFLSGIIADEDLETTLDFWLGSGYTWLYFTSGATPTGIFELNEPLLYRIGTTFPLINYYNSTTGEFTDTEALNDQFFNVFILRIPVTKDETSQQYRAVAIQPQRTYSSATRAFEQTSVYLGDLNNLLTEFALVERITFGVKVAYNNATGYVRIEGWGIVTTSRVTQINTVIGVGAVSADNVSVVPIAPFISTDMQSLSNEYALKFLDFYTKTDINSYTASTQTELDGKLNLNQTIPQIISGGTPIFDTIGYNTGYTTTETEAVGTTFWDNEKHTLTTTLLNGVRLQHGQEIHLYARNTWTGGTIYDGQPVSVVSSPGGSYTAIGPTDISDPSSATAFVGLATQNIAQNEFGYVTMMGHVHSVNTSHLTEGFPVYVDTTGGTTSAFPSAPNYIINVGIAEYIHPTQGRINVIQATVPRLQDLSDVDGVPLTTTGQIVVWDNSLGYFDFTENINNYITGATNLGGGTGIYSTKSGRNLQFNSIVGSGGTTISLVGNEIRICSTDPTGSTVSWGNVTGTISNQNDLWGYICYIPSLTGGTGTLNWTGSTANALGSYVDSTHICAEPNLTFDGSQLNVNGIISGATCVQSPTVCGTSIVRSPNIYGSTCVYSPIVCGLTCIKSPIISGTSFATSSTSLVQNLNADLLDGFHASAMTGGTSYTFTQGLTESGGTVCLGGTINSNISLCSSNQSCICITSQDAGGDRYVTLDLKNRTNPTSAVYSGLYSADYRNTSGGEASIYVEASTGSTATNITMICIDTRDYDYNLKGIYIQPKGGICVHDEICGVGLEYAAEYTGNTTNPRWIPDYAAVTGYTNPIVITGATNGLTKTGQNVCLGGTVTDNINLNALNNEASFNFQSTSSDNCHGAYLFAIPQSSFPRTIVGLCSRFRNDSSQYRNVQVCAEALESGGTLTLFASCTSFPYVQNATGIRFNTSSSVDGISVFDTIQSKGMIYADDYSAAGATDPRWIPDYAAVTGYTNCAITGYSICKVTGATNNIPIFQTDGNLTDSGYQISGLTGGTTYTFANGLCEIGGNVCLGGQITSARQFTSRSPAEIWTFDLSDSLTYNQYSDGGLGYRGIDYCAWDDVNTTCVGLNMKAQVAAACFSLTAGNTDGKMCIDMHTTNGFRITDAVKNTGMLYTTNYYTSGSTNPRWIPDWAAVTGLTPNNVITGATNVGGGTGIYTTTSNCALQLRTLVGSGSTQLYVVGDQIRICSTESTGTTVSWGSVNGDITLQTDLYSGYLLPLSAVTQVAITGATNGLTKTGKNVKLGGALTGNTTICGGYSLNISGNTKLNTQCGLQISGFTFIDASRGNLTNIRIGQCALYNVNANVFGNIGIGHCALESNTSGNYNIAIGTCSLTSNVGGTHNVAIGSCAMLGHLNACDNVAIGSCAMNQSCCGLQNVAVGSAALYWNCCGCWNTALGFGALDEHRSGEGNVALGHSSLTHNQTGSTNIAIGYRAGFWETGSNKLYIANSDTCYPLIYGDFAQDCVVIHGLLKVTGVTAGNINDNLLVWNSTDCQIYQIPDIVTGATNIGGGTGIYTTTSNGDLQLRTLVGSGSTSLYVVGDEIRICSTEPTGTTVTWGDVTGTISNQTDLWNYISCIPALTGFTSCAITGATKGITKVGQNVCLGGAIVGENVGFTISGTTTPNWCWGFCDNDSFNCYNDICFSVGGIKMDAYNDTNQYFTNFCNCWTTSTAVFKLTAGGIAVGGCKQIQGLTSNVGIVVLDTVSDTGLIYSTNYYTSGSTNPRWIPDWAAVTGLTPSNVITGATEGLTLANQTVCLYDASITSNICLGSQIGCYFYIQSNCAGGNIYSGLDVSVDINEKACNTLYSGNWQGSGYDSWLRINSCTGFTCVELMAADSSTCMGLTMCTDVNGITVTDSLASIGLKYVADYSTSGTTDPRWIPDYAAVTGYTQSRISGATGTITGATNLGTGSTVYASTSNKNLQFRSFLGGGGTSVNVSGDHIIISSAAPTGTSVAWGDITGSITSQVDLTNCLNARMLCTDFDTFTGTTLPNTYYTQTCIDVYTGATQTNINSRVLCNDFTGYTASTYTCLVDLQTDIDAVSGLTVTNDNRLDYLEGLTGITNASITGATNGLTKTGNVVCLGNSGATPSFTSNIYLYAENGSRYSIDTYDSPVYNSGVGSTMFSHPTDQFGIYTLYAGAGWNDTTFQSEHYMLSCSACSLQYLRTCSGASIMELCFHTNNGIQIRDDIFSKGLTYLTNYSAIGTTDPRWIPDYAAVTGYTNPNMITGSTLGLTKSGQNLNLGSTTIASNINFEMANATPRNWTWTYRDPVYNCYNISTITVQGHNYSVANDSDGYCGNFVMNVTTQCAKTHFDVGTGGLKKCIALDTNIQGIIVTDSIHEVGLKYSADYSTSGSTNPRWIPDWAAVTGYSTSGGITWSGNTVNALGTYVDSNTICAQPNLTFNGTQLNVNGIISGATCVQSPTICASSLVCSGNLIRGNTVCADAKVNTTCISAVSGITGNTICGTTCVTSPYVCGTTCVQSPNFCATTYIQSPIVYGTTCVDGAIIYGSTRICSPSISGTTVTGKTVCANVFCATATGTSICSAGDICLIGNNSKLCGSSGSYIELYDNLSGNNLFHLPNSGATSCFDHILDVGNDLFVRGAFSPTYIAFAGSSPYILGGGGGGNNACIQMYESISGDMYISTGAALPESEIKFFTSGSSEKFRITQTRVCVFTGMTGTEICATTCVSSPAIIGGTCVAGAITCGTVCIGAPISCASSCMVSPLISGTTVCGASCVRAPIISGTSCVVGGTLYSNNYIYGTNINASVYIATVCLSTPIVKGSNYISGNTVCALSFVTPSTSLVQNLNADLLDGFHASAMTGGTSYTFNGGLTESGGTVTLGDTGITSTINLCATTDNSAQLNIHFANAAGTCWSDLVVAKSQAYLSSGNETVSGWYADVNVLTNAGNSIASLYTSDTGGTLQKISLETANGMIVTDDRFSTGFEYNANYYTSGSTNPRWIPDWGAVTCVTSDRITGATNIGTGTTIYTTTTDKSLQLRTLKGAGGTIVSVVGNEIQISSTDPTGTTVSWGNITGTLSNQNDLQTCLLARPTGATNIGGGDGNIYSTKTGLNLQFKTISGGTNVTITDGVDYIGISTSAVDMSGSTANGVTTYIDANTICVEPNLTFDGTRLNVTGTICATGNITGATVCGATLLRAPTVFGSTLVCGATTCGTTCVASPITCGSTCVVGAVTLGSTCVCSPITCGSTCVIGNRTYGTVCVASPIISGSTCVTSPRICGTTCVQSPIVCGSTNVNSPLISGTTICAASTGASSIRTNGYICLAGGANMRIVGNSGAFINFYCDTTGGFTFHTISNTHTSCFDHNLSVFGSLTLGSQLLTVSGGVSTPFVRNGSDENKICYYNGSDGDLLLIAGCQNPGSREIRFYTSGNVQRMSIEDLRVCFYTGVTGTAIRATQCFYSPLVSGTTVCAHTLSVPSTSLVTNLNADYLDGVHGSGYTLQANFVTYTGTTAPSLYYTQSCIDAYTGRTQAIFIDTEDPTGWLNTNLNLYYDSAARTVTLSATTGNVVYYWEGTCCNLGASWTSSAHADTNQPWFLYSTDGVNFNWANTVWQFKDLQVIAVPANNNWGIREMHGLMPYTVHRELHEVVGTYRVSGFGLTNGTYTIQPPSPTDVDNTPGFEAGIVADEDLRSTITAWVGTGYTQLYFTGSTGITFVTNQIGLLRIATTYPYINAWNGATFSNTEMLNNYFANVYIIRIPTTIDSGSLIYRAVSLQPQKQYATLAAAQAENIAEIYLGLFGGLATEFVIVERITIGTKNTYSSAYGRFRIEAVTTITGSRGNQVNITTGAGTITAGNVSVVPTAPFVSTNLQDQSIEYATAITARVTCTDFDTFTGTTLPSTYYTQSCIDTYTGNTDTRITTIENNYVTGATNVGAGEGTIYTGKTGLDLGFKTICAGNNITIINNSDHIIINSTASGSTGSTSGITWVGATVDGIGTYVDANTICSEPNMTFNGSILNVTGTIYGSVCVASAIISGSSCVHGNVVCATSGFIGNYMNGDCLVGTICVTSPYHSGTTSCIQGTSYSNIVSGETCVSSPIVCGTGCLISPVTLGSTCVASPIVSGSTCVTGAITCGSTCLTSPITCGTTCLTSPITCGTTCLTSPITCGSTCVDGAITCGTTCVISPIVLGSTCVAAPLISGSTCAVSPVVCGTTSVDTPTVNASVLVSAADIQVNGVAGGGTTYAAFFTNDGCLVSGTSVGGGITWVGSTANGVGTYIDANTICSQPNMTFDGSTLSVTGTICASTAFNEGGTLLSAKYASISAAVTGATNVGTGQGVYSTTTSNVLQLRSVLQSGQTRVTTQGNDINVYVPPRTMAVRLLSCAADTVTGSTIGGEYRIPRGMTLSRVGAWVDVAGNTGTMCVDIKEGGTTILSQCVQIETGEKSSLTATQQPVISDAAIAADAILTFDICAIQTVTAAKGLTVWLEGYVCC